VKILNAIVGIFFLLFVGPLSTTYARDLSEDWCKQWCDQNKDYCAKCTSIASCGTGHKKIATFSVGKNWYACGMTKLKQRGQINQQNCEQFCDQTEGCEKCSSAIGCGRGLKSMRTFGGTGENWYACEKTGLEAKGEPNREACHNWCAANPGQCVRCARYVGCGVGLKSIKSFKGPGQNWYACKRR